MVNLIFQAGIKTQDKVSQISGRGVGLDAVRTYVESLGGRIEVILKNKFQNGFQPIGFVLTLPKSVFEA